MIGRLVLAALIAGIAAGLVLAGVQHFRTTPLILAAEKYENLAEATSPAQAMAHDATSADVAAAPTPGQAANETHAVDDWSPADGLERTLYTSVSTVLAGAGFALALAGISLLTGIPITSQNGLIWGVCGFLAVAVATGAGLSPKLPGMPVADVLDRQVWWVATILATGTGIYLIAMKRSLVPVAIAVVLIALPHIIGAPQPPTNESTVPAGLAAAFAANSVATAAVFWCFIGLFLGLALQKFGKDVYAS